MSRFKFTLTDDNGSEVFGSEFVRNWDEIESNLTRSNTYRGRVRKLTNTFEFVKPIRSRIMNIFANSGINSDIQFKIETLDNNLDEFTAEPYGSGYPLKAKMSTYDVQESTVELNFVDSDFQELISAGEKEKLNITTDKTLVGTTPTDYNTLLKTIWMPDRELELNSRYDFNAIELPNNLLILDDIYSPIPAKIVYKSDDDIKEIIPIDSENQDDALLYLLLKADSDKFFSADLSFNFDYTLISSAQGGSGDMTLNLVYRVTDVDDTELVREVLDSNIYTNEVQQTKTFTFNGNKSRQLNIGDSVGIFLEYEKPSGITFSLFNRSFSNKGQDQVIFINENSYFDATISKCIRPHDFFTHWIELMTGRKNAFYSDYFGLTELGYSQDGEGAYLTLMDGHMIRNLPIEEKPFNSSFKDRVEDFIKEKNLVASIEYIGDTEVFRIEKYTDTFKTDVKGDLGEHTNEISLSVDSDLTWGSIRVGSEDIELENLNGLNSAHGEVNYSTPLPVENELDLVTKWIKNDYAIESQRRLQYSVAPEESAKYDKKIFLVDAQKGATTDVLAITNQGFESITGILSPDKCYNLNLTPAKQVRQWERVINGCLLQDQDGDLILTKSASNNTLITVKGGVTIAEGDNIAISSLQAPIVTNQKIIIGDAAIEKELYDTIEQYPNNVYKFTNKGIDYYVFQNLTNYNLSDKMANFELNLSSR